MNFKVIEKKVKYDLIMNKIGDKFMLCNTILGGEPFDILKQILLFN